MAIYGVNLRRWLLTAAIIVSVPTLAQEGNVKGSGLSSDIYEKEDSKPSSFSAHVTMIRETDVIEVFFEGKNKGPYVLKEDPNLGLFKERLSKSQKNKSQNVTVHIKDDTITGVELVEAKAAPTNKKSDMESVLSDILKK